MVTPLSLSNNRRPFCAFKLTQKQARQIAKRSDFLFIIAIYNKGSV
jgi:hypothetical protein